MTCYMSLMIFRIGLLIDSSVRSYKHVSKMHGNRKCSRFAENNVVSANSGTDIRRSSLRKRQTIITEKLPEDWYKKHPIFGMY